MKNYNKKQKHNIKTKNMFLYVSLMIIEFVGGYIANSLSIMKESSHLLLETGKNFNINILL